MSFSGSNRGWWIAGILIAVLALLLIAAPSVLTPMAALRLRAAFGARGLDASWTTLDVRFPAHLVLRRLAVTDRVRRDTLFRAERMSVSLDPIALATLRSRVTRVVVEHAESSLPH